MIIDHSQRDNKSVNIYWTQISTFRNYSISRYNIKVWSDDDPHYQIDNSDDKKLSKYDGIEQNFYELTSASQMVAEESSEEDCFRRCIETRNL
jgi:hypothetical protein